MLTQIDIGRSALLEQLVILQRTVITLLQGARPSAIIDPSQLLQIQSSSETSRGQSINALTQMYQRIVQSAPIERPLPSGTAQKHQLIPQSGPIHYFPVNGVLQQYQQSTAQATDNAFSYNKIGQPRQQMQQYQALQPHQQSQQYPQNYELLHIQQAQQVIKYPPNHQSHQDHRNQHHQRYQPNQQHRQSQQYQQSQQYVQNQPYQQNQLSPQNQPKQPNQPYQPNQLHQRSQLYPHMSLYQQNRQMQPEPTYNSSSSKARFEPCRSTAFTVPAIFRASSSVDEASSSNQCRRSIPVPSQSSRIGSSGYQSKLKPSDRVWYSKNTNGSIRKTIVPVESPLWQLCATRSR